MFSGTFEILASLLILISLFIVVSGPASGAFRISNENRFNEGHILTLNTLYELQEYE